jgi:hypothetical protein
MVDSDPKVITLRRSTVVRIGIAFLVVVAIGIGILIGLNVGSSPTAHVQTVPKTTISATTTLPQPTTTVPQVTTTTTNPARLVLSPATTAPVVDECSVPLTYGATGDTNPACPDGGGINVLAWKYFAASYPVLLGLGTNATEQQALQTMCESSPPYSQVQTAAQMAATYYGWSFATVPTFTQWNAGDCTG